MILPTSQDKIVLGCETWKQSINQGFSYCDCHSAITSKAIAPRHSLIP